MDEEAILIVVENSQDEDGYAEEIKTEYPALIVRERSVTYNEMYKLGSFGLQMVTSISVIPKIILTIRREDWEQTGHINDAGRKEYATKIIYDGAEYDIIREYHTDRSLAELTCG